VSGVSGVSAAARDMNATCQIALCSRPQGWPRNPHRPGPSTSARPRRNPPSVRRPVKAKRLSLMPRSTAPSHPMTLGNMRGHEGARCR
jgi:hypothetical protein